MDYTPLRRRLHDLIGGLKDLTTHDSLADLCEQLGLPSAGTEGSKRDRLYASIDAAPDADLAGIAGLYLSGFARDAATRNEIQELVWALSPPPEVPVRFRREVAQALEGEPLYFKTNAFMDLIESLFILEDPFDFFTTSPHNLKWKINQWVIKNDDWSAMTSSTTSAPTLVPTSDSCSC